MLLREFAIGNHTINLTQDDALYIATVVNSSGEKVFYHEYNSYDKIKICFDEIIQKINEYKDIDINELLEILEKSTM